jgi:hypothetical protein
VPRWRDLRLIATDAPSSRPPPRRDGEPPADKRVIHAYAHTVLKPLLPVLPLGTGIGTKVSKMLHKLLDEIPRRTYRHRENRSKPRPPGRKPHKNIAQKNC